MKFYRGEKEKLVNTEKMVNFFAIFTDMSLYRSVNKKTTREFSLKWKIKKIRVHYNFVMVACDIIS